jgi:hypothetical protein
MGDGRWRPWRVWLAATTRHATLASATASGGHILRHTAVWRDGGWRGRLRPASKQPCRGGENERYLHNRVVTGTGPSWICFTCNIRRRNIRPKLLTVHNGPWRSPSGRIAVFGAGLGRQWWAVSIRAHRSVGRSGRRRCARSPALLLLLLRQVRRSVRVTRHAHLIPKQRRCGRSHAGAGRLALPVPGLAFASPRLHLTATRRRRSAVQASAPRVSPTYPLPPRPCPPARTPACQRIRRRRRSRPAAATGESRNSSLDHLGPRQIRSGPRVAAGIDPGLGGAALDLTAERGCVLRFAWISGWARRFGGLRSRGRCCRGKGGCFGALLGSWRCNCQFVPCDAVWVPSLVMQCRLHEW